MKKTCIIITGPTAVGKTSIAIDIAKYYSTEIISADSRQCFLELDIGVAKPSTDELLAVQHYFINSHSIQEEVSAADFELYALNAINKIYSKSDIAVMVGGTGLYIKAFCEGMDPIPGIEPAIRESIIREYRDSGIDWLKKTLREKDPAFFATGETENPQRMMRALEVITSTGKPISLFQLGIKKQRDFDIIKIGLELPREILYQQINERVDQMIREGLTDEVRSLLPFKDLNALQTVGYREIFEQLEGKHDAERAIELIKQNTRQYAKRQMTWFKKDTDIRWFPPETESILKFRDLKI